MPHGPAVSQAFVRRLFQRVSRSPAPPAPARRGTFVVLGFQLVASCACVAPESRFSTENALEHVRVLAGTIGSRPVGTEPNLRARTYIADQLRQAGFEVRIQETDATRPECGMTARVANIIGTRAGRIPGAIALVSHYDSVPESPGAADAAMGVAVAIEAGRALAARPDRVHTLVVALTDAEEIGLMGAAALVTDPVFPAVRAYLNFEAVGSAGPPTLFETGPANAWIVETWARAAPHPAGASFAREIYERLPNDTDFSILKQTGTPGLNFAPTGDSYSYHTRNDTPERLSQATIRHMGSNAVATVEALDRLDLAQRSTDESVYFDVAGLHAFAFRPAGARVLAAVALGLGLLAWLRVLAGTWRLDGVLALALTAAWGLAGSIAFAAAMTGAAWAVRAVADVYHPWYGSPWRFFLLLVLTGVLGSWLVGALRLRVPLRFQGSARPAASWVLFLPVWLALAAAAIRYAPAASYLASVPLLVAALLLGSTAPRAGAAIRLGSLVVFAVVWVIWVRPTVQLLAFAVPAFGRMPFVTPFYAYPLLLAAAALYVAPPLRSLLSARGSHPDLRTAQALVLVGALAITATLVSVAEPYTPTRPLRREARYVQDVTAGQAFWEVAGTEPDLGLADTGNVAGDWTPVADAPPVGVPIGRAAGPFVHRAPALVPPPEPPGSVRAELRRLGDEAVLDVDVLPREPGLRVALVLPAGVQPAGSNVPGAVTGGRWRAAYVAPPPEGIRFTLRVPGGQAALLTDARVVLGRAGLPGGEGWQRLPPWLPPGRNAWTARSYVILPVLTPQL